jgi:hypothetical protein
LSKPDPKKLEPGSGVVPNPWNRQPIPVTKSAKPTPFPKPGKTTVGSLYGLTRAQIIQQQIKESRECSK